MDEEVGVILVVIVHENGRIVLILDQPAPPEIADTFLVSRRPNHPHGMQVNGLFNNIDWVRCDAVDDVCVSAQKYRVKQISGVFFIFNPASYVSLKSVLFFFLTIRHTG